MLYDAYGRPIRQQELTREHAAPTLAGVRTIWNSTCASGLTPTRLASLLQSAADGDHNDYLTLAEEMEERDLHYACELGKRKLAVSRLPVTVEAATDDKKEQDLADAVRDLLRRPGFRGLVKDLLDGLGKGYSVAEILWNRSGSRWEPGRYEWRDPHFFQFDQVTRRELRLRDEADAMNGLPLAPYKFIVHLPRLKCGIPIRGGFARLAAWAFMCKGYAVKDWLAFAEVFGMPLRMGKYHSGASNSDIDILKMAVANLGSDAAAVFPESMQIELVEASKAAGGESFFERMANWFDTQVTKGILGQTATTQGTPGKLGNEDAQQQVRTDIRDDDAEHLEETLNRDLVRPYIDLNFGPQENYPQIILDKSEPEDTKTLAEVLSKLVPVGLKVGMSTVRDRLGLPDPDEDEELLQMPAAAMPPMGAAPNRQGKSLNTEQGAADAADSFAGRIISLAPESALVDAAYRILQEAGSLEEVARRLDELGNQPLDGIAEPMARAMAAAHLAGRSNVEDGD